MPGPNTIRPESSCVDDLTVPGQVYPEGGRDGVGADDVPTVNRVYVDVRLGTVSGVPATA